jgi:metallo-beta-lactamase family protein
VDITFIGATRTVTGSLHLFEYNKQKFLLECGLYQGHRAEAERINRTFPFKPKDIKTVILSHAHIDHSGNLPNLVKRGFSGSIFCTPATKDIVSLLLLDSAKIQQYDIEYLNKKNKKSGLPLKEPLYTIEDAEQTIEQLSQIDYSKTFEPVKGVKATLYDAGHILGSSIITLEAEGKKVLFSGDLGRKNMPIIKDPTIITDADYMILESTYGGRTHKSFEGMTDEFREIINEGRQHNGKIIIPAFAVERTQVLITMLKNLSDDGSLKDMPVYVDSPLATSVTEVFKDHPECFDKETYKIFIDSDPFNFPGLNYIKDIEESKNLNSQNRPMIIMSASGMCEGGRVTHHLIHSIEKNNNIIVITGFQARGTLGRKILEGADKVWIFNNEYKVRAQVHFMGGLSAHADGHDLLEYVKNSSNGRLKKIFLIHGDLDEAYALQNDIQNSRDIDVDIPQSMTRVQI